MHDAYEAHCTHEGWTVVRRYADGAATCTQPHRDEQYVRDLVEALNRARRERIEREAGS